MRARFIFLALPLLAGCAGGLSREECLYADWRAIGYEDGARGRPASAVSSHRQACAKKAAVTPDTAAYLAGREAGLGEFCQPSNGFSVGSRGAQYQGVCAKFDEPAFLAAYNDGRELYALHSDVTRAAKALSAATADLDGIQYEIDEAELALVSPATPHLQRIEILAEVKQLRDEKERIEDAIEALAYEHEVAQSALTEFRQYLVGAAPYGAAQGVSNASY